MILKNEKSDLEKLREKESQIEFLIIQQRESMLKKNNSLARLANHLSHTKKAIVELTMVKIRSV